MPHFTALDKGRLRGSEEFRRVLLLISFWHIFLCRDLIYIIINIDDSSGVSITVLRGCTTRFNISLLQRRQIGGEVYWTMSLIAGFIRGERRVGLPNVKLIRNVSRTSILLNDNKGYNKECRHKICEHCNWVHRDTPQLQMSSRSIKFTSQLDQQRIWLLKFYGVECCIIIISMRNASVE